MTTPVRPRAHTELLPKAHKKLRHCAGVLLSSLQYLVNTDLMGNLTFLTPEYKSREIILAEDAE
jgi:hypothetical protein